MDLYSGLLPSSSKDEAAGADAPGEGSKATPALPTASSWSMGASKLMAPPVVRRAPQPKTIPPAHKRIISHTSVTVVQEGGGAVQSVHGAAGAPQQQQQQQQQQQDASPTPLASRAKSGADSLTALQLQDEYDPAHPNEYATYLKEKRIRLAEQKRQAEEERRRAAPAPWEVGAGGDDRAHEVREERGGRDRSRERDGGDEKRARRRSRHATTHTHTHTHTHIYIRHET